MAKKKNNNRNQPDSSTYQANSPEDPTVNDANSGRDILSPEKIKEMENNHDAPVEGDRDLENYSDADQNSNDESTLGSGAVTESDEQKPSLDEQNHAY